MIYLVLAANPTLIETTLHRTANAKQDIFLTKLMTLYVNLAILNALPAHKIQPTVFNASILQHEKLPLLQTVPANFYF